MNRGGRNARLNAFEDEAWKRYMDSLCRVDMPPDKKAIVKAANLLFKDRGEARAFEGLGSSMAFKGQGIL